MGKLREQARVRRPLKHEVENIHHRVKEQRGERVTLAESTAVEDERPGLTVDQHER
jgi:hypothetical protein